MLENTYTMKSTVQFRECNDNAENMMNNNFRIKLPEWDSGPSTHLERLAINRRTNDPAMNVGWKAEKTVSDVRILGELNTSNFSSDCFFCCFCFALFVLFCF